MTENERIKNVYSKFTIKDFWNWWSKEEPMFMEIRIRDYRLVKYIANKYNLQYSSSGVYVSNAYLLKKVIGLTRERASMWFGINPRKKAYSGKGWFGFGGDDNHIDSINYIFIDIDRIKKEGKARNEDLENCDVLADKILERFGTQNWNKEYIKICSGNGVQLIIALDIPIKIPELVYDKTKQLYLVNTEFDKVKVLLRNGIGRQIISFTNNFKDKLNVNVDSSCFKIGQVAALPVTKNYKFGSFTWRGIVEMKSEQNNGLSDYVLIKLDDVVKFRKQNVFFTKRLGTKDIIREGQLMKHPLAKFMLNNQLPHGMINNKLWFSFKILLRDSNFNFQGDEFKEFHKLLQNKYNDVFPANVPEKKFKFNESVVNNYCIEYQMPLIYPFMPRALKHNLKVKYNHKWSNKDITILSDFELDTEKDIIKDMQKLKDTFTENEYINHKVGSFINSCIKKYGESETRYYFDNLMEQFFTKGR